MPSRRVSCLPEKRGARAGRVSLRRCAGEGRQTGYPGQVRSPRQPPSPRQPRRPRQARPRPGSGRVFRLFHQRGRRIPDQRSDPLRGTFLRRKAHPRGQFRGWRLWGDRRVLLEHVLLEHVPAKCAVLKSPGLESLVLECPALECAVLESLSEECLPLKCFHGECVILECLPRVPATWGSVISGRGRRRRSNASMAGPSAPADRGRGASRLAITDRTARELPWWSNGPWPSTAA